MFRKPGKVTDGLHSLATEIVLNIMMDTNASRIYMTINGMEGRYLAVLHRNPHFTTNILREKIWKLKKKLTQRL
jgi:predicted metallopeptidase